MAVTGNLEFLQLSRKRYVLYRALYCIFPVGFCTELYEYGLEEICCKYWKTNGWIFDCLCDKYSCNAVTFWGGRIHSKSDCMGKSRVLGDCSQLIYTYKSYISLAGSSVPLTLSSCWFVSGAFISGFLYEALDKEVCKIHFISCICWTYGVSIFATYLLG